MVFDGGRAFNRCAPDLDLHCQRVVKSAQALGLTPAMAPEEIQRLAIEGIKRFPESAELYIKPMFFTQGGSIATGTAKTDNIAEFAFANLWIVKGGVALTPTDNKTFLAGITRWRTMQLLNEAGVEAKEAKLTARDLEEADEIFSTGNYGKVVPCTRYESRELNTGPVAQLAKRRYFEWARTTRID